LTEREQVRRVAEEWGWCWLYTGRACCQRFAMD
jgi:hypothetical protein